MSVELGRFIQMHRERVGATQDELGRSIGVSQQTIAKWEAGKSKPRPKAFERLIEALKIDGSQLRQLDGLNEKDAWAYKSPGVVAAVVLSDSKLSPPENSGTRMSMKPELPTAFPPAARFNHVANTAALKRLLAPMVNAIEESSQWDVVVPTQWGNWRIDYASDEMYAKFLHAPTTAVLAALLRTNIYRYLWKYVTLSGGVGPSDTQKYQVIVITLPEDQTIDFVRDESLPPSPAMSNTRMLRRITSEAISMGIHVVVARTPEQVVSVLTDPSQIYEPGWDWPGHAWDENPDD
jgi:DNA-binding XRE family transcriptional regulator